MNNTDYLNNPGRYGYIRSSEDKNAMLDPDSAYFDAENNRWFEHIGCEFQCFMDIAERRRNDEKTIRAFAESNHALVHKEVCYAFDYNSTGDKVESGEFFFTEYENGKYRDFVLYVDDLSLEQAQEYIHAAIDWHYSDRFAIGRLAFFPCSGPWAEM